MNLDEFVTGIINNPDVIVRLFYTHGFGGGEADYYNSCLFCGYETVHVPLADSVCEIDDIMLKHIYQNHYDKADQGKWRRYYLRILDGKEDRLVRVHSVGKIEVSE